MTSSSEIITERAIRKKEKFVGRDTFFSLPSYFFSDISTIFRRLAKSMYERVVELYQKPLSDEALDSIEDEIYSCNGDRRKNDVRRNRLE